MSHKAQEKVTKTIFGAFQSNDAGLSLAAILGSKTLLGATLLASSLLPRPLVAFAGIVALISAYRNSSTFTFSSFLFPKKIKPLTLAEQRTSKLDTNSTEPINFRVAPIIKGDFCVFLIGLRVNSLATASQTKWIGKAMSDMLLELQAAPELGCMNSDIYVTTNPTAGSTFFQVQYWRSYDQLVEYARGKDLKHYPAWMRVVKEARESGGVSGIWHEAFKVRDGEYEGVYINMPPMGLGKVGLVPAVGKMTTSKGRTGATDGKDFIDGVTDTYDYINQDDAAVEEKKCPISGSESTANATCPVAHSK
ncbi:unnamed protein product [Umbelopsis vinacea]